MGFTLIELIMTMVLMGFAAIIIIPFFTAVTHSPDPVLREQAVALGQSMMDEILAKRWDEETPNGGGPICTSESINSTTRTSILSACDFGGGIQPVASIITLDPSDHDGSPSASERQLWNDVDDYNFLNHADGNYEQDNFWAQDGGLSAFSMPGFSRWVEVDYIASNANQIDATNPASSAVRTDNKRIVVTVTTPLGETLKFVAVSCNF